MTISSTINRISYEGNGATLAFSVPFSFFDEDELQVIERTNATGIEIVKSLNNDYTVEGGGGADGSVIATIAPPATVSWTVLRRTKRTQEIDYTDNDPFPAETHERGLDRITMIAQDSANAVDRALRFPATDVATLNPEIPNSMARAGKYLAFDSGGLPIASAGPAGDSAIPVSSFAEMLLDDTDAAAARATMGLVIGTDVAPAGISGDFVGRVSAFVGLNAPSGWLLLDGSTIGNLGSGAEQVSEDYENLYALFWDSMADTEAVVSTGRGANAASDWLAGKTLKLPDLRGRTVVGTGTGTGLTARIHGGAGGTETHLLTAAQSGLPAHSHTYTRYGNGWVQGENNGSPNVWRDSSTQSTSTNVAANAAQAHPNMQPFLALSYIVKY
jgi:microcystin-dependent protein